MILNLELNMGLGFEDFFSGLNEFNFIFWEVENLINLYFFERDYFYIILEGVFKLCRKELFLII